MGNQDSSGFWLSVWLGDQKRRLSICKLPLGPFFFLFWWICMVSSRNSSSFSRPCGKKTTFPIYLRRTSKRPGEGVEKESN